MCVKSFSVHKNQCMEILNLLSPACICFDFVNFFLKLGFTPCKAEQPLQGMELQEKEAQKD